MSKLVASTTTAIASALVLASAAHAGVVTQTVPFDYNPNNGVLLPVIQGFDTLGGTRELTAVTFTFNQTFTLNLFTESTGPTPLQAGDYSFNFGFLFVVQLGLASDKNPSPPFFGPGGFFAGDISHNLSAYDGIPGNDGPDANRSTFTDAYAAEQTYVPTDDPSLFAALVDVGDITCVLGGFTEVFFGWVNPPAWPQPGGDFPEYPADAALWFDWSDFRHSGDFIITYEYANVPTPGAALPLAAAGALTLRRRR